MLPRETFRHYPVRVTMTIAHHVANPESLNHDLANQAYCLLSGLLQEELWVSFRIKYQSFIETGDVGEYADHFNKKVALGSVCCRN